MRLPAAWAQAKPATQTISARKVLVQARSAVSNQQWERLVDLVAQARDDALLGDYAIYWILRWRTQDKQQPIPTEDLQHRVAGE